MKRSLGLASSLAICLVASICAFHLQESLVEAQEETEEFRLLGSYFNLRDYETQLMLNNKGPEPLDLSIRAFSPEGDPLESTTLTIGGNSYRNLPLARLLQAPVNLHEGSLELTYQGRFLQLGGQIRMKEPNTGLMYDEQLCRPEEFASSQLHGAWWLPAKNSQLEFVFTNTSDEPISVNIQPLGHPPLDLPRALKLHPHETRVIRAKPNSTYGAAYINHSGKPGALLARAMTAHPEAGYSAVAPFQDPAKKETRQLHGVGLRIGPLLGQDLSPVLILANHATKQSELEIQVVYTIEEQVHSTPLTTLILDPGETSLISKELTEHIKRQGHLEHATAAGIEIRHSGKPGTLTAWAASVTESRDQVFRVPLTDPKAHFSSAGAYPWNLEQGQNTMFYVKNLTSKPQRHRWYLNHAGEAVYSSGLAWLEPNETIAIDIRQLRDEQIPDYKGRLIPQHAEQGQVRWTWIGRGIALDARAEQVDLAGGVSSTYACEDCCTDNMLEAWVEPESVLATIGDNLIFTGKAVMQDCGGTQGPTEDVEISSIWFPNLNVVSQTSGNIICVGAGLTELTATIVNPFVAVEGERPECQESEEEFESLVPVEVQSPTLACTSPVTRGESTTCTIANAGTATISGWKFTSSAGNVNRSSGTSSSTWSGKMVQSGTVEVVVAGQTLSDTITVNARSDFKHAAVSPVKKNNRSTPVLTVPNPPVPNGAVGRFQVTQNFSFNTISIVSGPNTGFKYVTSVSNSSQNGNTTFFWVIAEDLETTSSVFYQKQCGDYDAQSNPTGFISGAKLKANVVHHESSNTPNSHYYQYKTEQDKATTNLGIVGEAQIGSPSVSIGDFAQNVEDELNAKLAMITAATVLEPCNGDARNDGTDNCKFSGNINFAPYQDCN